MEYKIREKLFGVNKTSASGTSLTLNDTVKYPINKLTIDGVCEQETTKGYQLLDITNNFESHPAGGGYATYKLNEKGGIELVSGNESWAWGYTNSQVKVSLEAGTYIVSANLDIRIYNSDGTQLENNFTLAETANIGICCKPNSTKGACYIIVEQGSTAHEYEPYTGGQPSPSPDYPQEIKTITGNIKVTSCGKNLFDINNLNFENVWVRPTGEKIAANNNGFLSYVEILPNAEYILSLNKSVSSIGICEYDKNKNFIQRIVVSNSSSKTIITSPTTKYIGVFTNIDGTTLVTKDIIDECEPQLEKSNQATPYEPYQGSSLNIAIPENEFVGKLDDTYKDTLKVEYNEDDGQYHLNLYKNIGKVVLDGSGTSYVVADSNWSNHAFAYTGNNNRKPWGKGLSDYFTFVQGTGSAFVLNNGEFCIGQGAIIFRNGAINTLDEFKTWLSTHNTEVYYPIATPYEIDLGIVDTLLSYDEITNIFTDSDLYPVINVKYYNGSLDISNYEFSIKEV